MREIVSHKAPGVNDWIRVETVDDPDKDGRCWKYQLYTRSYGGEFHKTSARIEFQQGEVKPLEQGGLNGVSEESLLAVVVDRMVGLLKVGEEEAQKAAISSATEAIKKALATPVVVEKPEVPKQKPKGTKKKGTKGF